MTAYERKLNQIVDEIFLSFRDWTIKEIADASKLSVATVWRIEQRVTKLPRFKTVFLLAKAAGYTIEVTVKKQLRLHA